MALRPCTGPATATIARSSAPCTSPRTSPARGARYRRNEGSVVSGRWSAIGLALITDHRPPTTPPMVLYLFGRVTGIVVVFLIVSVLAFFLMHSVPGGPFDETNQPLPPAAKANILRKYGLDRPLYEQYFNYMGNALQGDFGISFQSPTETVIQLITRAWPTSMQLGGLAILLAFIIGLSSGILAAVHQNTWVDYVVTFISTLGITVPNFVIALWLLLVLAVGLGWLPTGGWPNGLNGDLRTVIMPVITLALAPSALVARYTRSSLVEVLHQEYVRTARAKGLAEQAIVVGDALKNTLITLIT